MPQLQNFMDAVAELKNTLPEVTFEIEYPRSKDEDWVIDITYLGTPSNEEDHALDEIHEQMKTVFEKNEIKDFSEWEYSDGLGRDPEQYSDGDGHMSARLLVPDHYRPVALQTED